MQFHPDIPASCPPAAAQPANQEVFRAVSEVPSQPSDFLSTVEVKQKNYDESNCHHWGCSIWVSIVAVEHATAPEAIAREKAIEQWPRKWKVELIEAMNPDWLDLGRYLNR